MAFERGGAGQMGWRQRQSLHWLSHALTTRTMRVTNLGSPRHLASSHCWAMNRRYSLNRCCGSGFRPPFSPSVACFAETRHSSKVTNVMSFSSRWLTRSEEHTSELQSRLHLVCRLLLEKKTK